jgi:hypothetical protein
VILSQKNPNYVEPAIADIENINNSSKSSNFEPSKYFKNVFSAKCQWLTPIILTTQEAEIRRIVVQSQPGEIVPETLSQKYLTQKGMMKWLKV